MNKVASLCLFWGVAVLPCVAQTPSAELTGLITDPMGAVVPNAEIDAANLQTGTHWKTISNGSGYYTLPLLPPGNYTVAVGKPGFRTMKRSTIVLVVAQVARIDFELELGAAAQTVEVRAAPPLLESQVASLGQVVQTRTISNLPLNGRNYLELARLTAGVLEPPRGDVGGLGGSFVANGVRAALTNFNLDGTDNNTRIVDIQNRSYEVVQPPIDALQEFKIETANYSAEYGYSAGAVVNATVKSGTNQLHGVAYEFLRNDQLDARDFFALPSAPKPLLQRNQFGATLGGPLIRDKFFLFGSWERTSENRGLTRVTTVPTDLLRDGDFSGQNLIFDPATTRLNPSGSGSVRDPFAGNRIPSNRMDPVSAKLLALLPGPNVPGKTANNFIANPAQRDRIHRLDSRGDLNISDQDKLFGRFSYLTRSLLNPGFFPPPLIGANTNDINLKTTRAHSTALGATHIFSTSLVNEIRTGYSRIFDLRGDEVSGPFLGPQFGFKGIPDNPGAGISGLPGIAISGFTNLGETSFVPNGKVAEVLQFQDNVSWIKGNHTLKFGGQFEWVRSFFDISGSARGTFSFSGVFTQNPQNRPGTGSAFADFLLGIPSDASLSRPTVGDVRQRYVGLFVQNDWKITPQLTINAGLRYELWTPRVERHDLQANFVPALGKLVFPENKIPAGIPSSIVADIPRSLGDRSLVQTDNNNLGPRLGLVYQLRRNTVLRAGYGIFYGGPSFPGVGATPPGNPPFFLTSDFPTDQLTPDVTFARGFPADALAVKTINPATATFTSFEPDFKWTDVQKWSFGLQQQVAGFLLEANYVGTKGTHLPVFFNINAPLSGPGPVASRRVFQGFGNISFTTPMGNSTYHAVEARLERRYANGLFLLVSFTHSKTIDLGGIQLGGGDLLFRDVRNIRAERGLALFDMRNRLVISGTYALPFGKGNHFTLAHHAIRAFAGNWQINAIATFHDGQPFTPALGFSTANTGDPRPDRVCDGSLTSGRRTLDRYFDKTCFPAATPFRFGNSGRNILISPGAANLDLSVFKRIPLRPLGEAGRLEFRAEFFNFLNHPQFGSPSPRVDVPQGASITSLSASMREVQFGLKVIF